MAFRAPVFAVLLFAASSPGQAATGAEDSPIASTSEPLQQETGGSSLAEELELLLAGCAFCDPSPPPPAAPAPSRKALLCKGHLDETGSVCCTAGCGQSRVQCAETADVCSGSRRGDLTTKANCCPSTIRHAAKPCQLKHGGYAPCVLPDFVPPSSPPAARPLPLAPSMPPAHKKPHARHDEDPSPLPPSSPSPSEPSPSRWPPPALSTLAETAAGLSDTATDKTTSGMASLTDKQYNNKWDPSYTEKAGNNLDLLPLAYLPAATTAEPLGWALSPLAFGLLALVVLLLAVVAMLFAQLRDRRPDSETSRTAATTKKKRRLQRSVGDEEEMLRGYDETEMD